VYPAVSGWKSKRTLTFYDTPCPRAIAADDLGHVFIGYSDAYSSGSGGTAFIEEYDANVGGEAASIRTIPLAYGRIDGISVDTMGDVFVLVQNQLLEYGPKTNRGREVLPGTTVAAFTLDANNNLYVAVANGPIQEYAPGATTPMRTIPLSATGLAFILAIAAAP
jgi:hypothetical protein